MFYSLFYIIFLNYLRVIYFLRHANNPRKHKFENMPNTEKIGNKIFDNVEKLQDQRKTLSS